MLSIADLSEFVIFRSETAKETMWEWVNAWVLMRVVSRAEDNMLVRVRRRFSLAKVIHVCEGYRKYDGRRGQEAKYGIGSLCWAILIRRLYGWDYRMLEEQIRVNLLVRWATGFGLHEETPDHTVLWRFEEWLRTHDLDGMFVTILEQIDTDYPEEHDADLIGDTFGMRANIRDVSLNTLVRQTGERLLSALRKADPEGYRRCITEFDHDKLFGSKAEKPEKRLSSAEQEVQTLRTAQAATACLEVVKAYSAAAHVADEGQAAALEEVRNWSGRLSKILADEFTTKELPVKMVPGSSGAQQERQKASKQKAAPESAATESAATESAATESAATESAATESAGAESAGADASVSEATGVDKRTSDEPGPETATDGSSRPQPPTADVAVTQNSTLRRSLAQERGSFRIISAVDPDATVRVHGKSIIIGFNVGVLASVRFVRYILTLTGSTSDGSYVASLLSLHLALFGFLPDKYIFDSAAGTPKYIADVDRASEGKTQLVARQIVQAKQSPLYHRDDFTLSTTGLTCPNGVETNTAYRTHSPDGWSYIFSAAACKDCPLWGQCRKPDAKPDGNRAVLIADDIITYREHLAYLSSPQAKADFAFRSNIERIIAALTRFNDARRARVRGLLKVSFQNLMAATAFNLKTWFTLTRHDERKGLKEKPPCPQRLYPLF
jgi:hypothetical protein